MTPHQEVVRRCSREGMLNHAPLLPRIPEPLDHLVAVAPNVVIRPSFPSKLAYHLCQILNVPPPE